MQKIKLPTEFLNSFYIGDKEVTRDEAITHINLLNKKYDIAFQALRDIKKHQQIISGNMRFVSGTFKIVEEALKKIEEVGKC